MNLTKSLMCVLLTLAASTAYAEQNQPAANTSADLSEPAATSSDDLLEPAATSSDDLSEPTATTSIEDLARAAQNPIANLVSVPFQNNLQILEGGSVLNTLLIQPVIPFNLNEDWILITRTIVPVLGLSSPPEGFDKYGLGDVQQTFFFSPAKPTSGGLIWGLGPVISYPTATDAIFGSDKWSSGIGFVGLKNKGRFVYGALINNIWSFAGNGNRQDVNQLTFQPFVNYNFAGGWYLQSAGTWSANWEAPSGQQWIIPIGGGVGRTFKLGNQPMSMVLSNFYNIETPDGGPRWNIRFNWTLLFPQ
jgi:hypothetical protein